LSALSSSIPRSLLRSWAIQRRVIFALVMREVLTRYGRHNIGFLWLFVEPMLFTIGITTLWTATKAVHGSSLPIVAFALTGYSTVLLWRNMPGRCVGSLEPNLSLMYHRNVRTIDVFLSRALLEAIGATMSFLILSIFFISIEWMDLPVDLLLIAEGWFLTAWFGTAFAVFLGAAAEKSKIVEKIWHPAAYLLFPISGAAYLVDALPTEAQNVVLWLPMVHGTEMIRDGYFGHLINARYDVSYMITFNVVLTIMALAVERSVSREVVPK